MQFTLIAASLLAAAGISVAAPLQVRDDPICPLVKEGDDVWKISTLWARKLDGKTLSALTFNIQATNGGTLNFTCGASADKLESSKIYSCGENSSIFFSWNDASNALLLQQSVSDDFQQVGTTTVPTITRAGGSGPDDIVIQGVSEAYITLAQYPGLARAA